jgi:hypothetical protein
MIRGEGQPVKSLTFTIRIRSVIRDELTDLECCDEPMLVTGEFNLISVEGAYFVWIFGQHPGCLQSGGVFWERVQGGGLVLTEILDQDAPDYSYAHKCLQPICKNEDSDLQSSG